MTFWRDNFDWHTHWRHTYLILLRVFKRKKWKCKWRNGRDENGRPQASTVDQVENCSLVDVDEQKNAAWSTSTEKTAVVDINNIFHDLLYNKNVAKQIWK